MRLKAPRPFTHDVGVLIRLQAAQIRRDGDLGHNAAVRGVFVKQPLLVTRIRRYHTTFLRQAKVVPTAFQEHGIEEREISKNAYIKRQER